MTEVKSRSNYSALIKTGAEMGGYERQRLYGALILLVTALFVAAGYAPLGRWRRPLRAAAIGFFVLALAAAAVDIILWLIAPGG